jgi:hypothetical protein
VRQHPSFIATAVATVFALAVLLALGVDGWPGTPSRCVASMEPTCFCERLRPGLIAQPANTLSNFGFILVGLGIAGYADRRRGLAGEPENLLTTTVFYPTAFAVVTAMLGPGSMAMHAAEMQWGGLVDVASMYVYATFLIAFGLTRSYGLGMTAFLVGYGAAAGGLVAAQAFYSLWVEGVFGGLLGGVAAVEVLHWRRRASEIRRGYLLGAGGLFGLAFAVWVPSLTGGPFCDPESWLQGHAVWHVLCACAAGSVFLYYRSESAS